MPERPIARNRLNKPPGRPQGATSFDPVLAAAFGTALREARAASEISQEELALAAGVERSYLGRLERGQSMPTLSVVFKVCRALQISSGKLVEAIDMATADVARKRLLRRLV